MDGFGEKRPMKVPGDLSNEDGYNYQPKCNQDENVNETNISICQTNDTEKVIEDTKFIAQHMKNKDAFENVS